MRYMIGTMIAATLTLTGCQQALSVRSIQQADTREVWVHLDASETGQPGLYRCYDNAGKPQCVKVEITTKLTPSAGFCANHPQ